MKIYGKKKHDELRELYKHLDGKEITHDGETLIMHVAGYSKSSNKVALILECSSGEPYATVTKNIADYELKDDEIIVNDQEGKNGLMNILLDNGLFEFTGIFVVAGYTKYPICKIAGEG